MEYSTWLKNRNLSDKTITIYTRNYQKWLIYLHGNKPNINLFVKYINQYAKNHNPASTRLMYASILSILKFQKKWNLLNECRCIRLPKIQSGFKDVIDNQSFLEVFNTINLVSWRSQRNWLIFSMLLFTGMRVSELIQFQKSKIINTNKFTIIGKGNKHRTIYLNSFLIDLLSKWENDKITITSKHKSLTSKQINLIVKNISIRFFNKKLTPHSLRRSYATNLLRNNINIEIVKRILGHSTINTTSKYIQYTEQEVLRELESII